MPKWAKLILALLLLPFCAGAVAALARVCSASGSAEHFWVAFLGGAACWVVVFLLLPKPMRLYVFGHELTHAVWVWIFGHDAFDVRMDYAVHRPIERFASLHTSVENPSPARLFFDFPVG